MALFRTTLALTTLFHFTMGGIAGIKFPMFARDIKALKNKYFIPPTSNPSVEDFDQLILQAKDLYLKKQLLNDNTSSCAQAIETTIRDLSNSTPYAVHMLDAWGKPESGIFRGNLLWEGRYFECRSSVNQNEDFSGKACQLIFGNPQPNALQSALRIGICFPSKCSATEMENIFTGLVNTTLSVDCPPEPHQWDAVAIFAVFVCCLLASLVAIATVYEIYKRYRNSAALEYHSVIEQTDSEVEDESLAAKCLKSFSIRQNTLNVLSTEKRKGNIHCLHGLRFISMTWVVLGHTFVTMVSTVDNVVDAGNLVVNRLSFMAMNSATFSVDSFFFLSGLLVAFLGLREMSRNEGKISIWKMYLVRYLRLTPAYAFCILFAVSLFGLIGEGPSFNADVQVIQTPCTKYWWANFLYINNVYPFTLGDECVDWSWYLANDMQFYLISPFFLILLYRKPKIGIASLILGIGISMAITGALSNYYGLQPMPMTFGLIGHMILRDPMPAPKYIPKGNPTASNADILASDIYTKPWCRVGVYFVGMLTGYILHITKGDIKMNKITVAVGWILTAIMELSLVYGLYGHIHNNEYVSLNVAAFYNAVSRPLWAVGLGWVVIACVSGNGGIVNRFLSWSVFIPLSRLTYCLYLIHILVIGLLVFTQETSIHYSMTIVIVYFLAILVLGNAFAYVVSMLVEAPMLGIQKALLKDKPKNVTENSDNAQLINEN